MGRRLLVAAAFTLTLANTAGAGPLEDLQPGQWYEVPNSQMSGIDPCAGSRCSYSGVEGQSGVIDDWTGGAFAIGYGTRGGLIAWGGGHGGYLGNEIYMFDVGQLRWVRASEPVNNPTCSYGEGELQDGSPCAPHTYDYVEYHPGTNSFIVLGSASNHLQGGGGSPQVHLYDFDTKAWRRGARKPTFITQEGASSAYDPNRDVFWLLPAYGQPFAKYDPNANGGAGQWTEYQIPSIDIDAVAAIDPGRDLFVVIDGRDKHVMKVWDLKNPTAAPVQITTIGDTTLQNSKGNGFEWDPVSKAFVGWGGGSAVYKLTPPSGDWRTGTWVWTKINPAASNTVTPTAPNSNATYSRWRYVPALNVFVVVNRVTDNVFFYKLSPGGGSNSGLPVSLTANPGAVGTQGTSTLNWSASGASSCSASASPAFGSWSGTKGVSGSEAVGPLGATTRFTLTCQNSAGTGASAATVTVGSTPAPTVNLAANPTSVVANGTSTLSWTTSNATSCTASGAWSGSRSTSGSVQTAPLSASSTFNLACTGAGGTTQRAVTVSVTNAPVVSFSASPISVASGGRSTLSWSASNATGCTASGAWAGNKAASGSEQTPALSANSTFNLACSGAGGTTQRSVTVNVTSGGTPAPTLSFTANPTLVVSGARSQVAWSASNATSCMASGDWSGLKPLSGSGLTGPVTSPLTFTLACSGAGGTVQRTVNVSVSAGGDALTDFQRRASHPDVVRAISFDSADDVTNHVHPDGNFERSGSGWDQSVKASGNGALRFTIPSNSGSSAGGKWKINFSDAPFATQFGAGEEFYVQWRQRFDDALLNTNFQGSGGWKQIIIGEGDVAGQSESDSCTELELVMQNTYQRGYPQMYHNCGSFEPFQERYGAYDFKMQNAMPSPYCLYSGGKNQPSCSLYRPNEWIAFQVRVKLGPRGTGTSSLEGPNITGFTNSTVQMWAAREGQPSVLVHSWSGLVLRETDGKEYGKLWLLPYMSGKSSAQIHPVAHTWYDELIVSRSRIADPGVSSPTGPAVSLTATPNSIASQGTSTLNWSASGASSCSASASPAFGSWSGTKGVSGSQAVGPLGATTRFTLTCQNSAGTSSSASTTVTVGSTPAPTVNLAANPTSVVLNGTSTLSWTTSNATSCTASGAWSGARSTSGSVQTQPLTATRDFTLACTGTGGTTQRTVRVSVTNAPVVSFSASPTSVASGGRSTLSWSASNATGCTASGAWAGNKAASGSEQTASLLANSTFNLACSGAGGTTQRSVTVNVTSGGTPAPTLSFTANPTLVVSGARSQLTWSASNATSCTGSGDWSGLKPLSGSGLTGPVTSPLTFTLACSGAGGTTQRTVTVNLTGGGTPAPTLSFTANPTLVASGARSQLTWSTSNATSCTASGAWSGTKLVSGSEQTAALMANSTFNLACSGAGGTVQRALTISVSGGGSRAGTDLVAVTVASEASSAQSNVPVTFGQVFKTGTFSAGSTLGARLSDGTVVPAQIDKMATHADGSLRHGVITLRLPSLGAGASQAVQLSAEPSGTQAAAVQLSALLATSYDVTVNLTIGGTTYTASARERLQAGPVKKWLEGPLVSEWIVGGPVKAGGTAHPHLAAYFHVRAYAGMDRVRTDVVIENNWSHEPSPSNFTYTYSINVGGTPVAQGTSLTHYHHARWHRVVWTGSEPKVYAGLDQFYLQDTKAIPRYRRVTPSGATLSALRQSVTPMSRGDLRQDFGDTGYDPQIGPMPKWAALFAVSGDRRALRATLANADAGGTYSTHFRDKNTGYPVSIADYPTAWAQGGDAWSLPEGTGNPNAHDLAHQPAIAYLPYLATGDYYYLEELQFWANYNMLWANPNYREREKGLVGTQVRALAWSLRTLGEAAYATPDAHPLKAYFTDRIGFNIAHQTSHEQTNSNVFGVSTEDGHTWVYDMDGVSNVGHAPWQDDFYTWTIGHLVELGFTSANWLLQYKAAYPIDRLTHPDYCYVFAAHYQRRLKETASGPLYTNWAEVYRKNHPASIVGLPCGGTEMASQLGIVPGAINSYNEVTSYIANLYPALAVAVDSGHARGLQAWTVLEGRALKPAEQDWGNEPEWAIIPRTLNDNTP